MQRAVVSRLYTFRNIHPSIFSSRILLLSVPRPQHASLPLGNSRGPCPIPSGTPGWRLWLLDRRPTVKLAFPPSPAHLHLGTPGTAANDDWAASCPSAVDPGTGTEVHDSARTLPQS